MHGDSAPRELYIPPTIIHYRVTLHRPKGSRMGKADKIRGGGHGKLTKAT